MTRVVHCKQAPFDVYIGRPGKWGNPFRLHADGNREQVIQKFELWIRARPGLIKMVKTELKGKVLGCWCKPEDCHGDVLARIADEKE